MYESPRGGEAHTAERNTATRVRPPSGQSTVLPTGRPTGWPSGAPSAVDLGAWRAELADLPLPESEAEAIDLIRDLEEHKAACAAAQARITDRLHRLRTQSEADRGVPARDRGRGLAAEVALARRESPSTGSKDLGLARALCQEMPHTLEALTRGVISEWKATIMCRETAWLPVEARRQVDELMAGRLEELGVKKLAGVARAHAQRLDPASAVAQAERSERERRVSVRPAPGGMAYLTALLPMAQAVGCLGTLKRTAATTVGTGQAAQRTQDQVMADLLVERVTGQQRAQDLPAEIHLIMTDRALWGVPGTPGTLGAPGTPDTPNTPDELKLSDDSHGHHGLHSPHGPGPVGTGAGTPSGAESPAWLLGHGPLPAEVARRVITDSDAQMFIRRLYTDPTTGQLTAMDSTRRAFGGALRRLILVRDDTCRTPYCDAAIKHVDHVTPHRAGGATSMDNASGLCARCNYTKEYPHWHHASDTGTLDVTTPTGHHYTTAPPLMLGMPPAPVDPPPDRPPGPLPDGAPGTRGTRPISLEDPVLGTVTLRRPPSVLERALITLLVTTTAAARTTTVGDPPRASR